MSCSSVVLNIVWSVGNLSRRDCAATGPIPGNPSRMNFFCSSGVLRVFDGRIDISCFGLSYFLVRRIRKFAVSSSSSVKIIGTWKSIAIDRNIPLIAFSWTLNLL